MTQNSREFICFTIGVIVGTITSFIYFEKSLQSHLNDHTKYKPNAKK